MRTEDQYHCAWRRPIGPGGHEDRGCAVACYTSSRVPRLREERRPPQNGGCRSLTGMAMKDRLYNKSSGCLRFFRRHRSGMFLIVFVFFDDAILQHAELSGPFHAHKPSVGRMEQVGFEAAPRAYLHSMD